MLPDIRAISGDFTFSSTVHPPGHRACETVALLQRKVLAFIAPNQWPHNSPNLKPVGGNQWINHVYLPICKKCTWLATIKANKAHKRRKAGPTCFARPVAAWGEWTIVDWLTLQPFTENDVLQPVSLSWCNCARAALISGPKSADVTGADGPSVNSIDCCTVRQIAVL